MGQLEMQLRPELQVRLMGPQDTRRQRRGQGQGQGQERQQGAEQEEDEEDEEAAAVANARGRHVRVLSERSHAVSGPFLTALVRALLPTVRIRLA